MQYVWIVSKHEGGKAEQEAAFSHYYAADEYAQSGGFTRQTPFPLRYVRQDGTYRQITCLVVHKGADSRTDRELQENMLRMVENLPEWGAHPGGDGGSRGVGT